MERSNSFLYHMKQKTATILGFLNPLPRNTKEDTICFQTNDVKFLNKLKCHNPEGAQVFGHILIVVVIIL